MSPAFLRSTLLICTLMAGVDARAAHYAIDPSHASVQFRISHLGFSTMTGRFDKFEGSFEWDKDAPASAAVEISIDTDSINTNWAERDKHLRDSNFLNVDKFPTATFKSTSYTGDASGGRLLGELTLHGVTRTLAIDMKRVGEGRDPWGGYRAGFDGTATLRRADYGINYDLGVTAERMQFDLHIEGIRK
jgi:polyisoprenoid-binding protein YceI